MVQKCSSCGTKIIKFQIKGQPEKTLGENFREGTILWKNAFKTDLMSILLFLVVIFMVIGYKADIAKCDEIMADPYSWCENSGCISYLQRGFGERDITRDGISLYELNKYVNLTNFNLTNSS